MAKHASSLSQRRNGRFLPIDRDPLFPPRYLGEKTDQIKEFSDLTFLGKELFPVFRLTLRLKVRAGVILSSNHYH
jgi:hypothetical protein